MRYLSQCSVSKALALRARLVDGYAWHQEIWKAFPGRQDACRDFLFRTDSQAESYRVLLLSEHKPEPTELLAWQTKAIAPAFLTHKRYRFRIKANPTFRRSKDKRRLAICQEPELRQWIAQKLAAAGMALAEGTLSVSAPVDECFTAKGKRGKHVAVDFEGVADVADPDALATVFHTGIGPAKGFGYGLLMLQPTH